MWMNRAVAQLLYFECVLECLRAVFLSSHLSYGPGTGRTASQSKEHTTYESNACAITANALLCNGLTTASFPHNDASHGTSLSPHPSPFAKSKALRALSCTVDSQAPFETAFVMVELRSHCST